MGRSAASPSAACAAMMRSAAWSNDSSTSTQCGGMSGAVRSGGGNWLPMWIEVPLVIERSRGRGGRSPLQGVDAQTAEGVERGRGVDWQWTNAAGGGALTLVVSCADAYR